MSRLVIPLIACVVLLVAAVAYLYPRATLADRLVAVSWGDGPMGKALYGAYVVLEPAAKGYEVRLHLYIDRPSLWVRQEMEPVLLGTVATPEDAVQRWGHLAWDAAGLHVGQGPEARLIPASEIQRHR